MSLSTEFPRERLIPCGRPWPVFSETQPPRRIQQLRFQHHRRIHRIPSSTSRWTTRVTMSGALTPATAGVIAISPLQRFSETAFDSSSGDGIASGPTTAQNGSFEHSWTINSRIIWTNHASIDRVHQLSTSGGPRSPASMLPCRPELRDCPPFCKPTGWPGCQRL